jgi:DNA-binding transcriptional MerR regulator
MAVAQRALSTDGAAAYLDMPPATLAYWRSIGVGPKWFKLGRRVRYDRADLDSYIDVQREASRHGRQL